MYKKQIVFFSSIVMLVSAFFFGCDKQSNIGIAIVPDNYKINTILDTVEVEAYTFMVDSVLSSHSEVAAFNGSYVLRDSAGISKFVLGKYTDPVFGEIKAYFVTEIVRGLKPAFGENATVDSLVLQLFFDKYDSTAVVYGNAETVNTITVSRIHRQLSPDLDYYSPKDTSTLSPESIGSLPYKPFDFKSKAKYDSVLTIRLMDELGQTLLNDSDTWENERFTNYFNGLLVSSSTTHPTGAISIFNILDAKTKVALYYHNSKKDSLYYIFNIDGTCSRFNLFSHNFSNDIIEDLNNPESDVVYLQGGGGLRANISFPTLSQLRDDGIWAVNKAEFILPEEDVAITGQLSYPTPLYLHLRPIDDNGSLGLLEEYVGESLQGVRAVDGKYTFDITYWAQQIVKEKDPLANNGFVLMIGNENITPAGVVLKSPGQSDGMKLLLTLTKIADKK